MGTVIEDYKRARQSYDLVVSEDPVAATFNELRDRAIAVLRRAAFVPAADRVSTCLEDLTAEVSEEVSRKNGVEPIRRPFIERAVADLSAVVEALCKREDVSEAVARLQESVENLKNIRRQ